jgi:hypothetical protein
MNRDRHPYLSNWYMFRAPGTMCLNCGEKLKSHPRRWVWVYGCNGMFLGYVHGYSCYVEDDNDDTEYQKT